MLRLSHSLFRGAGSRYFDLHRVFGNGRKFRVVLGLVSLFRLRVVKEPWNSVSPNILENEILLLLVVLFSAWFAGPERHPDLIFFLKYLFGLAEFPQITHRGSPYKISALRLPDCRVPIKEPSEPRKGVQFVHFRDDYHGIVLT